MRYTKLPDDELISLAKANAATYANGDPFPNISLDALFNEQVLDEVLNEFPDLKSKAEIVYNDSNQIKLASRGEHRFGGHTRAFMHFLNSQPFLEFLTALTGIEALIPDPYFEGGGAHQILPGGMLKIHADFNKDRRTHLDRRLNVLVYLNKDWQPEWGGNFELWDRDMKGCVKQVSPLFNRMAVFSTTDFSYHGHPDPLQCPPDRSRKSLALYYYTNGRPADEVRTGHENHPTLFQPRPQERSPMKDLAKQLTPPIVLTAARKILSRD